MRTLTQCLVSCVFLLCGLANLVAAVAQLKHHYSEIHNRHGKLVRHYIEGGIVYGECETYSKMNVFLTINGKNITGQEEWISFIKTGQSLKYGISLNRSTPFGEYRCHAGDEFKVTHTIQYILCDPDKIIPEKVCQKGQFCVINGSNTKCQSQIDCEKASYPKECSNKTVLKDTSHPLCSVYRDAVNIPAAYYLEDNPIIEYSFPFRTGPCMAEPMSFHKGKRIEFYSTVPIGNNSELKELGQHLADKRANNSTTCHTHNGGTKKEKSLDEMLKGKDLGMILSQESLPKKTYVECLTQGRGFGFNIPKGRLDFYILFYAKNVRFYVVQNTTSTRIDVTNRTEPILLDSPFQCSVSVPGGLYVKVSNTKENSSRNPMLGSDSIEMARKKDSSAPYICWAVVYFYEQMTREMGFKELYKEKREIYVRSSTTAPEVSTTKADDNTQATATGFVIRSTIGATKISTRGPKHQALNTTKGTPHPKKHYTVNTTKGTPHPTTKDSQTVRIIVFVGIGLLVILVVIAMIFLFVPQCKRMYEDEKSSTNEEVKESHFSSMRARRSEDLSNVPVGSRSTSFHVSNLQPSRTTSSHTRLTKAKPKSRKQIRAP